MNTEHKPHIPGALRMAAGAILIIGAASSWAFGQATTDTAGASSEPVKMNPFEVVTDQDGSFQSSQMGSGSRLSLELKDAPIPYSVINREFIDALGITDLREAAAWSVGNSFYYTDNGSDSRGLSTQYISRGNVTSQGGANGFGNQRNFYQNASISSDSYAVETYDFGRGPNAALFGQGNATGGDAGNGGLAGVSSSQTKRARFDKATTQITAAFGSWDFQRFTIDINQPINDKVGVRINALNHDQRGWRQNDMERTRGLSLAGTYKVTNTTEFRLDSSLERREQHTVGSGWDQFLSGWDGSTVFRGPITNSMRSTTGTIGATSVANASYGTIQVLGVNPVINATGLTFNGEPNGVDRQSAKLFYDPYDHTVMNYQNFATTRRADATTRTPLWTRTAPNGQYYQRAQMGNAGNMGNGLPWPNLGVGRSFFENRGLPADQFYTAIENSKFRIPSWRRTDSLNTPIVKNYSKDLQFALSQRVGNKIFVELGGDINRNNNGPRMNIDDPNPGGRSAYLDLNMIRPDGSPNKGFLDVYSQIPGVRAENITGDSTLRLNVAYSPLDLGRWGNYTFNVQGSSAARVSKDKGYILSIQRNADPRLWTAGADQLNTLVYWSDPVHAWTDPSEGKVQFTDVVWDANNNNPVIQPTALKAPGWVINSWGQTDIKTLYSLGQMTASYFNNRVILTGAYRYDRVTGKTQASVPVTWADEAGFPGTPANWDGFSLRYKPSAPADYFALTYLQLDANGNPVTGKAITATTRPRTTINGISVANHLYDKYRFRDDFSNPEITQSGPTKSTGLVWHTTSWFSPFINVSDSYNPNTSLSFDVFGEIREPTKATAREFGATLSFFGGKLTSKYDYYVNVRKNDSFNPAMTGNINTLYQSNRFDDPDTTTSGRNVRGLVDIPGSDYQSRRNFGYEAEMAANVLPGLRFTANGSVSSFSTSDQGNEIKQYIALHTADFRTVLEDAGGVLDTTLKPTGSTTAPGLAKNGNNVGVDTTNAVNAYNNIWINYDAFTAAQQVRTPNPYTLNIFGDYTIQTGKLKGLLVGAGLQKQGPSPATRLGNATIIDPSFAVPTAVDDPSVSGNNYVFGTGFYNTQLNLAYRFPLKSGSSLNLALRINNPIDDNHWQIGDNGVFAGQGFPNGSERQPDGNLNLPNRYPIPSVIAKFKDPISFQLTATYTFAGGLGFGRR